MTRDFSDELLSAFLDDELSPAERAQVERHLEASPADRQLLAELTALRGEVANLPPHPVSPGFADRVVLAAIAEAEKTNDATGVVSRAPPEEQGQVWRRWNFSTGAATVAALAASVLLVFFLSRQGPGLPSRGPASPLAEVAPQAAAAVAQAAALSEQLVAALAESVPGSEEAIILRLQAHMDAHLEEVLEAALAEAGLQSPSGSASASAALLAQSYQRSLAAKAGDLSAAAAQAVFIEAPYERLLSVANQLEAKISDPLRLEAYGKLALGREWNEMRAEGEAAAAPIAQRLNASQFRLQPMAQKAAKSSSLAQPGSAINPQQRFRVLLLIETSE